MLCDPFLFPAMTTLSSCIRSLQAATSIILYRHGVKSSSNLRRFGAKVVMFASGTTAGAFLFAKTVQMANPDFMADPITSLEELWINKDDMKSKMELMIMKIQVCGFM